MFHILMNVCSVIGALALILALIVSYDIFEQNKERKFEEHVMKVINSCVFEDRKILKSLEERTQRLENSLLESSSQNFQQISTSNSLSVCASCGTQMLEKKD